MLARLALLATLVSASLAQAAPPVKLVPADDGGAFTLRGKGMRGSSTLGGAIARDAAGKVTGELVIMITTPDDTATACRYSKFSKVKKVATTITFDAVGRCFTVAPNGSVTDWKASNAFSIVQGKPHDSIDVNMYGSNGITIPGGHLDSGDFTLQ